MSVAVRPTNNIVPTVSHDFCATSVCVCVCACVCVCVCVCVLASLLHDVYKHITSD